MCSKLHIQSLCIVTLVDLLQLYHSEIGICFTFSRQVFCDFIGSKNLPVGKTRNGKFPKNMNNSTSLSIESFLTCRSH